MTQLSKCCSAPIETNCCADEGTCCYTCEKCGLPTTPKGENGWEEKVQETINNFWKMLSDAQFVKSTDSITGEMTEYPPAIEDMEAIVRINGEFDKYQIDDFISSLITRERATAQSEKEALIKELIEAVPLRMKREGGSDMLMDYNAGFVDGNNKARIEILREIALKHNIKL